MTNDCFFAIIMPMNSFNAKIFGGTVALSSLLLAICMLVFMLIPSNAEQNKSSVKEIPDFSMLNSMDFTEEYFAEAGFKTEYADDYSPEDDEGLALYRQPQSRPAVEWFYTHVTSSREVALAILENADKNDIPLSLAFSLAYVESRFKSNAVNSNTNHTIDRGLFQLNSASFPKLTEDEFFDPKVSAKYGMSHLRYCMDIAGNEITALAMYNAGTSRVKQNKTPQHTLNYVAKISNYRVHLESKFSTEVLAFYSTGSGNTVLAKK